MVSRLGGMTRSGSASPRRCVSHRSHAQRLHILSVLRRCGVACLAVKRGGMDTNEGPSHNLALTQVRAAATEAAQRASGVWRAPADGPAPSLEALPLRAAPSPSALPRASGGGSLEGVLVSTPQSMQSPRAMAAPLTGSRSPPRPLPGASPLGGGQARDSALPGAVGSPPRLSAIPATIPAASAMRVAGTEGGGALPADEPPTPVPAERAGSAPSPLMSSPSHAKGLPPTGRRVTRRSSHRTLRTLQVRLPCACTCYGVLLA